MEVIFVDLSDISFSDQTFLVGNKDNISIISKSIEEIGVLSPPILRLNNGKLQIVAGWKRLLSCKKLGHKKVLCKIYSSSELSDHDFLKIIYIDNKDRISDLELAELIVLFQELCSVNDSSLLNEVLPLLDIPANRKHFDRYIALSSLNKAIKSAFYEDKITIEQCQMLSEVSKSNQLPILELLLLNYKLNNNESRQFIQIIEEITLRDLKSVSEVIAQAEESIEQGAKGKNELRGELRRLRYPDLILVETKYKKAVEELKLPKEINLYVNQFFEGNDLELRIRINNSQELSEILSKLEDSVNKGLFEKLLKIIQDGK